MQSQYIFSTVSIVSLLLFSYLKRKPLSFPHLPSVHLLQKRRGADHESVEAETMPTNSRHSLCIFWCGSHPVASNVFCDTSHAGLYMSKYLQHWKLCQPTKLQRRMVCGVIKLNQFWGCFVGCTANLPIAM